MTATPLTVNTTIPIVTVISSSTAVVYSDADMTSPVTVWDTTTSVPNTWYLDVHDTARIHVTITAAHNVVLLDQDIYLDAGTPYTIDANRQLNPLRLAQMLAPPSTWAGS